MIQNLYKPKVCDLMLDPVLVLPGNSTVAFAVDSLQTTRSRSAVVIDSAGRAGGIFAPFLLLNLMRSGVLDWNSELATIELESIPVCHRDDLVDEKMLMSAERFLVVDQDCRPLGVLHRDRGLRELYKVTTTFLQTFLDHLPSAAIGIDLQERIGVFNAAAAKLTGIPMETARGAQIRDVIPNTRLPEVIRSGEEETDERICIGDAILATSRFPINHGGRIIGAAAVLQDISVVEATSHKLGLVEELNRELHNIIELSADGLVVSDGKGVLLHINKAYEEIVGIRAKDFVGKHVNELIKDGVLPDAVTLRVLKSGKQENLCLRLRGREVLLTGQPIFDDEGRLIRVVATIRDLTELSMLKEQVQTFKELSDRYRAELAQFRARETQINIVSEGVAMRRIVDLCLRVAQVDSNILITGESGTGKELLAKLIHRSSQRTEGPFIAINCGAIPHALLESELFGYEEGAFSGAKRSGKPGLLETAQGGTLFLDEIAEMPLELQVKLLRVIQERSYYRVGGNRTIALDARVIAATNKDLPGMVSEGKFREDLFYRLNVIQINIPPLRERKEEIPSLVMHFLDKFNKKYQLQWRISPETMGYLMSHDWPGNVRELENTLERMVVLSTGGTLDPELLHANGPGSHAAPMPRSLKQTLERVEREALISAYGKYCSTREAAKVLGISQASVVRKLQRYGYSIKGNSQL